MKTITLSGSKRENVGSKFARELRNQGQVPAVIYGEKEPIHIHMDEREYKKIVYTPEVYNVILDIDGTSYNTIFKDAQFNPLSDRIEHADFLIVAEGKPVTVSLPVVLTGNSIGIRNGGKLSQPLRKLKVSGLLSAIPDNVEIDITKLRIGMSIKVSEMALEGVEFLDPASNVVVAVKTARGAVDEEGDDEGETEEAAAEEAASNE